MAEDPLAVADKLVKLLEQFRDAGPDDDVDTIEAYIWWAVWEYQMARKGSHEPEPHHPNPSTPAPRKG